MHEVYIIVPILETAVQEWVVYLSAKQIVFHVIYFCNKSRFRESHYTAGQTAVKRIYESTFVSTG